MKLAVVRFLKDLYEFRALLYLADLSNYLLKKMIRDDCCLTRGSVILHLAQML